MLIRIPNLPYLDPCEASGGLKIWDAISLESKDHRDIYLTETICWPCYRNQAIEAYKEIDKTPDEGVIYRSFKENMHKMHNTCPVQSSFFTKYECPHKDELIIKNFNVRQGRK